MEGMQGNPRKILAGFLSVFYFTTQVALGSLAEANFWSERQKVVQQKSKQHQPVQLARLPSLFDQNNPSQLLNHLPNIAPLTSNLSKRFEKEIPRDLASKIRPLFQALPPTFGTIRKVSIPKGR